MPEPTRQSLCCSQPEHRPTLSHQMSQRRKMQWPDRGSNPGPLAHQQMVKQETKTDSHVYNPILSSSTPVTDQSSLQNTFNSSYLAAMRVPQLPFFSGEDLKGDISFEIWKFELNCPITDGVYPDSLILHAIRKSLRCKSRDILLTLGESASPSVILNKLEGIYGNVSSNEVLFQQFYLVSQLENESVADYSVRIENLLRRATQSRPIHEIVRNEMLCAKLWNQVSQTNSRPSHWLWRTGWLSLLLRR